MNRLKEISLGAVLGLSLGMLFVCEQTESATKDFEVAMEPYQVAASVPVSEQFKADSEKIFIEYQASIEEQPIVETAPYNFIPLDDDLQIYLEERCAEKDLNFWLVVALMESESQFKEDAEGDSGNSYGLMQINSCWWESMKEAGVDVFDNKGNIEAALLILQDYLTRGYTELEAIHLFKCGEGRGNELLKEGIVITGAKEVIRRAEEWEKQK